MANYSDLPGVKRAEEWWSNNKASLRGVGLTNALDKALAAHNGMHPILDTLGLKAINSKELEEHDFYDRQQELMNAALLESRKARETSKATEISSVVAGKPTVQGLTYAEGDVKVGIPTWYYLVGAAAVVLFMMNRA